MSNIKVNNWVKWWLIVGLVMIFFQIIIGGITRLTGSGLSITKWEIVTGTLPPLNQAQWEEAFNLYKETPQYQKINEGMSMHSFKWIYFWEYFHRLWARLIGFAFIIPFVIFLRKGWINQKLKKKLLRLVLLGALVAVFGWIMVMSGLNDRPWVSAYKLAFHLTLALFVFSYLLHILLSYQQYRVKVFSTRLKRQANTLLILLFVQIVFGAFMSGMHAGLLYPTWPKIGQAFIPPSIFEIDNYLAGDFWIYDQNTFIQLLIHFLHRSLAYIIFLFVLFQIIQLIKFKWFALIKFEAMGLLGILLLQVVLGIVTVISCKGNIPIMLASLHQAVAIVLLLFTWLYQRRLSH